MMFCFIFRMFKVAFASEASPYFLLDWEGRLLGTSKFRRFCLDVFDAKKSGCHIRPVYGVLHLIFQAIVSYLRPDWSKKERPRSSRRSYQRVFENAEVEILYNKYLCTENAVSSRRCQTSLSQRTGIRVADE